MKLIRKDKNYIFAMLVLAVLLFYLSYGGSVNKINATMLAFTYKYGFISRGFIGSVYHVINKVLPIDMMQYGAVLKYTQIITLLFYVILGAFFVVAIKRASEVMNAGIKQMCMFYMIFAIPMFANTFNFGRLDIYCIAISIICAVLLIKEKFEWLVVPLAAISIMVHQGNVFMYMNIILVLLMYKAITKGKSKGKKYMILFILTFVIVSMLFLYFELFSHFNGDNIYDNIVADATSICEGGIYHEDVIDHEILGVDLTEREIIYRKKNTVEFPIFVVIMLPYILIAGKIFKNLIMKSENKMEGMKYLLLAVGAGTILPDMLLKCDYGRWMFAVISYYSVTMISVIAMGDKNVEEVFLTVTSEVKEKHPESALLLGLPLILIPFGDVAICGLTYNLADKLNTFLLHWW